MKNIFSLSILILLFTACATTPDIKTIKPRLTKSYSASYQEIWNTVPGVLGYRCFVVTEENKEKSYILATRYPTACGTGWGYTMAIFIDTKPNEIGEIDVSVVCRYMTVPDLIKFDWESDFLARLGDKLEEIKKASTESSPPPP